MFRRILVPTDGSDLSNQALNAAIRLAEENGAALVVLNVQPVYRPPVVAEVPVADVYSQEEYEAGALQVSNKLLGDAAALAAAASVPHKLVPQLDASPWEAIIRVARDEQRGALPLRFLRESERRCEQQGRCRHKKCLRQLHPAPPLSAKAQNAWKASAPALGSSNPPRHRAARRGPTAVRTPACPQAGRLRR